MKPINSADLRSLLSAYNKNLLFYKPTPKMRQFHEYELTSSHMAIFGGNRTGKTLGVCAAIAQHLTGRYVPNWPGHKFNYPITHIGASVSLDLTKKTMQKFFFEGDKDIPPLIHESLVEKVFRASGTPGAFNTVKIKHLSGGTSTLYFMAYKQGAEVFQGMKIDTVHMDESCGFDLFSEAQMRITKFGSDRKSFIYVTQFPRKFSDPLIEYFMDHAPEGVVRDKRVYMHMCFDDNPYLSEQQKEDMRKSIPPHELEAREKGIPSFGSGRVFTFLEKDVFVDPFDVPSHWPLIYGLDCSSTSSGTWGAVLLAWDRDNDIIYVVKDYSGTDFTPAQHVDNIKDIFGCCGFTKGIVDPAGAGENMHMKEKTIDYLRKMGLNLIKAVKVAGTKEASINSLRERIDAGKFKIIYSNKAGSFSGCINLVKEIRMYSRDDNGLIIKRNDHVIDALFYAASKMQLAITRSEYLSTKMSNFSGNNNYSHNNYYK